MLPSRVPLWETSDMADAEEDLRGRRLYDALMAIKPRDLPETEWASQAGVNRGFFTNLKGSNIAPRSDTMRKLLRHIKKTDADLYAAAAGLGVSAQEPDVPPSKQAGADDDTVEISQLDLSFSMGPGTNLEDYIEETRLRFDLDYIRSFTRTPPARLHIARGVGESMFPTLLTSDMVWIDTTQRTLNQQDRVWAISLYGAAAIKRLRAIGGGKVLVISDNTAVDNQEVDAEDLVIGGRVIRFARDL